MGDKVITPFLKWPGGKNWFVKKYIDIIPKEYNRYFEPFLGGGAVFFALRPKKAVISDRNEDLINLYNIMRDNPAELAKKLLKHQRNHSKEYYYKVRECIGKNAIDQAARMLYLNRTCYNGMYRVNRQGMFNVPIGTKMNCIYDIDMFEMYSNILKGVEINSFDFEKNIDIAGDRDLIFADPPYTTKLSDNFIKYNEQLFTWSDQIRLCKCLSAAKSRGAIVILTDIVCNDIKQMYEKEGFLIKKIKRMSNISGKKEGRKIIEEYLITSF